MLNWLSKKIKYLQKNINSLRIKTKSNDSDAIRIGVIKVNQFQGEAKDLGFCCLSVRSNYWFLISVLKLFSDMNVVL